jgi:pyruvate,orthophosphate dikinase
VEALGEQIGVTEAYETYGRLLSQFGVNVFGLSAKLFDLPGETTENSGRGSVANEKLERCRQVFVNEELEFPQDPYLQLKLAIEAVFRSWLAPRADRYRKHAGISIDIGTAVVVQAMVFGNIDDASGTGVAFTRDPATGDRGVYGDFLCKAQGEDVVAGEVDPDDIELCRRVAPSAYDNLIEYAAMLEVAYRDMCDIEFTVEQSRLWVLQVRRGQRTAVASVRIALDLIQEGIIDADEAIGRIDPAALQTLREPIFDPKSFGITLGVGQPASPGAAVGFAAFNTQQVETLLAQGKNAILIRAYTSPDDIGGFIAAEAIVTAHGGRTSHAAVVARGLNKPAVCGVEGLVINGNRASFPGGSIDLGDELSVDGSRGLVLEGSIPLVKPPPDPRVLSFLEVCDQRRRLPVVAMLTGASWSDGEFVSRKFMTCGDEQSIDEASVNSEIEFILLSPANSPDQFEFEKLVDDAVHVGKQLALLVDKSWPRSWTVPLRAPWNVIVAGEGGDWMARLVACLVVGSSQG